MISVICSTYNSEACIAQYLEYVNKQTLYNFEVVFVDAASTDTSLQTIKDYTFREGIEKTVIECTNKVTIFEAWNLGIKKSKYEYVINYNTDDKLFPSALLVYKALAQMNPEKDVFVSNCFISHSSDHSTLDSAYHWSDPNELTNQIAGCCCGPFPLLKKNTVKRCGYFDESMTSSGDWEMWLRMKVLGAIFHKTEDKFGVYYHNPEGMSTSPENHADIVRQDTKIREVYGRFLKSEGI
tara:strand:- start:233 stop:949 length:717 start_codon:yes stop_codon:yes gene_type:complete